QIQINQQPVTPTVSHNSPVCEGTPIQLTASNVVGGGNLVYEWTGPNGFNSNVQNPLIENADTLNAGAYVLRVGVDGCFSLPSSPIPLQIKPSPEQPEVRSNASIADPICEGEILQLETDYNPDATYQWVGPNGFNSNLYNPFVSNVTTAQSGQYSLNIIVADCPSEVVMVDVGIQSKPANPIAGNSSPICADADLQLNVANAVAGVTYEWFKAGNNEFVGEGAPLTVEGVAAQDAGDYYVVASIGNCATDAYSSQGAVTQVFTEVVIENATREVAYAGGEIFSCDPEVEIAAIAPEIAKGSWSIADPTNSAAIINPTNAQTVVANLETGVTKLVWSLDNGVCGVVSTDTLEISYNVPPTAVTDSFSIGVNEVIDLGLIRNDELKANDINIYINDPLQLGETQRNFEEVEFANNLDSLSRYTYFAAENAVGTEIFEYEICNKECPDLCSSAMVVIQIGEDVECEAPELVTPNDDGFNDTFIIPCLANHPNSSITIFNRWGDEIYRSDNYQNDWGGTYNGELLPTGTYYYLLEVNDAAGTTLNGYLFLQR
ncbi:MAG: gliding motility-associated C-terminal domain-containing protein, partial [Bacteroidota bacterium]